VIRGITQQANLLARNTAIELPAPETNVAAFPSWLMGYALDVTHSAKKY
jgi:hypothetical protein